MLEEFYGGITMNIKKIRFKLVFVTCMMAMVFTMFSVNAFAQESDTSKMGESDAITEFDIKEENSIEPRVPWVSVGTYGPGAYQIEYVNFKDKTNGAIRTYNANLMRIKPAWNATDSTSSEVELLMKVIRKSNGDVAYEHRFKLSDDTDGQKDAGGWWYAESPYFPINNTSDYFFYYEVFTADGYQATGNTRCGQVHVWIDLV